MGIAKAEWMRQQELEPMYEWIEKNYGKFSRDDRRRLLEAASMQVSVPDHNIKRL